MKPPKGFTLIEILSILAGLAIIGGLLLTIIRPTEIFKCSRDSQRINDLNQLNTLLIHYINNYADSNLGPSLTGVDEASSTIYISVPSEGENIPNSITINNKIWQIKSVNRTNLQNLDGSGWLPVNLTVLKQLPIYELPIDPTNSYSQKLFYSYVFHRRIKGFELNANLECARYKLGGSEDKVSNDGGDDLNIFEIGSLLTTLPSEIYGSSRLTGLKPKIGLSEVSLIINTPINTASSTEIQIYNLGSTTLAVYNVIDTNKTGRIVTDKKYLTVQPRSFAKLRITCNGQGLYASKTVTTTLELWNNDIEQNPANLNITCNFQANPRISVSPKSLSITTKTGASSSASFTIFNKGDINLNITDLKFYLEDSTSSCYDFVTVTNPSSSIPPQGSTTVSVRVNATNLTTKYKFTCKYYIQNNDPYRPTVVVPISVTVKSKPGSPNNLNIANYTSTSIQLIWDSPSDTGYGTISYYRIYRAINATPTLSDFLASTTATNYNNTGLDKGTKYCYRISAVNEVGESGLSNVVCEVPSTVPGPPTLSATAGNKRITLNWSVSDNGGSMITGYDLYENRAVNQKIKENYTETSFEHTGLKICEEYRYYVVAKNRDGESPQSNIATATPYGTSSPPKSLSASSTQNSIIISWQPPDDNTNCAPLSYYRVYRATSTPSNFVLIASTSANTSTYTDINVASNTIYYYEVTAVNQYGESDPSNFVRAKLLESKCQPPSNLSATPGDRQIRLAWTSSPSLSDGDYYYIYVSTGTNYLRTATVIHPTISYTHTGLINGQRYYYYVTAKGTCEESNPSNIASSTPGATPSAPRNLNADSFVNKIILQWEPPLSDGGYPILYYKIYKDYSLIATTSSSTLSYTDTNITPGASYNYAVSAVNQLGEGERASTLAGYCTTWGQVLGGVKLDSPSSIYLADESHYVIVGKTKSYTNFESGILIKTDLIGNIEWVKIYHLGEDTSLKALTKLSNGDYIVVGEAKNDILLMKISSATGNVIWAKLLGGNKREYNPYIDKDSDDFLYLGATTMSFGAGQSDIWIVKLDQNGNIIWSKVYGGRYQDEFSKLIVFRDGSSSPYHLWFIGNSKSFIGLRQEPVKYDWLIVSLNVNNGEVKKGITLGSIIKTTEGNSVENDERVYDIKKLSSGDWALAGETDGFKTPGLTELMLIRLKSDFDSSNIQQPYIDAYTLGTAQKYNLSSLQEGYLGDYIAGWTDSLGEGENEVLVTRFTVNNPGDLQVVHVVTYGGSENDELPKLQNPLVSTNPRLLAIVGKTNSVASGDYDIFQIKVKDLYIYNSEKRIGFEPQYNFKFIEHPTSSITVKNISGNIVWGNVNVSVLPYNDFNNNSVNINSNSVELNIIKIAKCFISASTTPSAPRDLQVSYSNPNNSLSWQTPSNNGGSPILYYNIYRNIGNALNYIRIATTTATSSVDNIGILNDKYCYKVTAVNSIGEGPSSNEACVSPLPVPQITNLTVTPGDRSNLLSWSATNAPNYFKVYRYVSHQYLFLASTTNSFYTHTNLQPGTEYCYAVTGVNSSGEGPYSNIACGTPNSFPSPPQSLTISVGDKVLNLNWQAPVNDGGSALLEYKIYRRLSGSSYSNTPHATQSSSIRNYSDTDVVPGNTYCYVVTASNSFGESSYSNEVCAKAGTKPGKFYIQILDYGESFVHLLGSCAQFLESYYCTGGYPIGHYKIYRSTDGTNYSLRAISNTPDFVDYDVISNTTYYYTLSAVNQLGLEGPLSDPQSITTNPREIDFNMYQASGWVTRIVGSNQVAVYEVYLAWKLDFGQPQYISKLQFDANVVNSGWLKIVCPTSNFWTSTYLSTNGAVTINIQRTCSKIYLFEEQEIGRACEPSALFTNDYDNLCKNVRDYLGSISLQGPYWVAKPLGQQLSIRLNKDLLGGWFVTSVRDSVKAYK